MLHNSCSVHDDDEWWVEWWVDDDEWWVEWWVECWIVVICGQQWFVIYWWFVININFVSVKIKINFVFVVSWRDGEECGCGSFRQP